MKKIKKILCLCLVFMILFGTTSLATVAEKVHDKYLMKADSFATMENGYRSEFILDFDEYSSFQNSWLSEIAKNNKLKIEFYKRYDSLPILIIYGKDGEFALQGTNGAKAKDSYRNYYPAGLYSFSSPYSGYYLQDESGITYYEGETYRIDQTTDSQIREKYRVQPIRFTMEMNGPDSRVKLWGTGIGFDGFFEFHTEKTNNNDKFIFDWRPRPKTEIIRIDKLESFSESEYMKDSIFNVNAANYYYRGCEGLDGEYEWVFPDDSEIRCYKLVTDENGIQNLEEIKRYNDDKSVENWNMSDAEKYIEENYELVAVTDPVTDPTLYPTKEEIKRKEMALIDERYPSDEYLIDDEDLKSGFKEKNIDQYGKYKDSDGNVHKITALNGKVSYETFKSELIGVARFKLFNNTAAWFDKISSNGWADVEIRHYSVDLWVDEILVDENDETYFMCIKGDLGEQWFMELSTATKAKGERGNEWIQDSNYQTQTDEGYYNFEPVCEFSEEYIDMFTDGEKNFEVIVKFESEDKLEIESVVLKRLGSVMYTAPGEDIQADLGFRMHFFEDSFGEDGRLYKQNFPDDYDRLISDYNAYVEKYKDVVIDVNQEFKPEEIKKEDEVKDDKPVDPNKEIDVFVNGNKLELDVAPVIVNERTMVPMRAIFEALGAEVTWFGETQTVTAEKDDIKITLQINSNVMYKNDEVIELDAPAALYNNRTLVPVRAVSEAFEKEVVWDAAQRTVTVN